MSSPCSLCLEDLLTDDPDQRFLRCVALPGRQPGLRLCTDGSVGWMTNENIACELMVSLDQQLLLFRPRGAPPIEVRRGGRHLFAPIERPVVLLDGDEVWVAGRRLRAHIHGETTRIEPPTPLLARVIAKGRTATALMAVGAAMLSCNRPSDTEPAPSPAEAPIESAARLPEETAAGSSADPAPAASVSAVPQPTTSSSAEAAPPKPTATTSKRKPPRRKDPIEVRFQPPFTE